MYFKKINEWLILLCILLIPLGSCGQKQSEEPSSDYDLSDPEKKSSIILRVQDSYYLNSDFEKYVSLIAGNDYKSLSLESLSRLLDDFIEEKIFLEDARNKKISLSRLEQKEYLVKLARESRQEDKEMVIKDMESSILFEGLLIDKYIYELVKDIEVAEEEVQVYYDQHKREFLRPERVKVSQILLETEDKAVEVLERGKDSTEEIFRKIAQEESIGAEASRGGVMGVFEMGQLPLEMDKVIFSMKVSEVSPVVESSYGYHIFRLDERYEPELVSAQEAFSEIRAIILDQEIKKFISQHLERLKKNMEWDFYAKNLSFPYKEKGRN